MVVQSLWRSNNLYAVSGDLNLRLFCQDCCMGMNVQF